MRQPSRGHLSVPPEGRVCPSRALPVQPALPFDLVSPDPPHESPRDVSGPASSVAGEPPAAVFVRHPRARRYVVRVRDDGTIRVTIPSRGSRREACAFVARQRHWIEIQLRRLEEQRARRLATALDPAIEDELRTRARRELPERLLELAVECGVRVSRVSVRNQRWRWGSCSRRGHICLNWRLVQMPVSIRDYVMIHELMHLKRMDHSPRFWTLVAHVCPRYREAREWLRRHADALSQGVVRLA